MTLFTRLTALSTTIENSGLTRLDDKELIDLLDDARTYVATCDRLVENRYDETEDVLFCLMLVGAFIIGAVIF